MFNANEQNKPTPIIKWAGGKRQLLPELIKRIPFSKFYQDRTYFEPFFGGGALFFNLMPHKAVINDINLQLINMYNHIRNNPEALIQLLEYYETEFNNIQTIELKRDYYNNLRSIYNNSITSILPMCDVNTAALLIFLNKAGYNGLYRVNKKGEYNVPFGNRLKINIADRKNIYLMNIALQSAFIYNNDFEVVCESAQSGDFVFFDSPYYDTFTSYQSGGFSEQDHLRLYRLFERLSARGVLCMMTNNNCEYIHALYRNFNIEIIPVKRLINCDATKRTGEEVIIRNY